MLLLRFVVDLMMEKKWGKNVYKLSSVGSIVVAFVMESHLGIEDEYDGRSEPLRAMMILLGDESQYGNRISDAM